MSAKYLLDILCGLTQMYYVSPMKNSSSNGSTVLGTDTPDSELPDVQVVTKWLKRDLDTVFVLVQAIRTDEGLLNVMAQHFHQLAEIRKENDKANGNKD